MPSGMLPSSGTIAICPEQYSVPFVIYPCEYGPIAPGAFVVEITLTINRTVTRVVLKLIGFCIFFRDNKNRTVTRVVLKPGYIGQLKRVIKHRTVTRVVLKHIVGSRGDINLVDRTVTRVVLKRK